MNKKIAKAKVIGHLLGDGGIAIHTIPPYTRSYYIIHYSNGNFKLINDFVKRFKGRSSRYLRKEFPELLKMPTLWTRSYFLSTAGNVSSATIQKYIEQQWSKI